MGQGYHEFWQGIRHEIRFKTLGRIQNLQDEPSAER